MPDNQVDTILKMFEYNLWANTELIKVCSDLDDEQLETEMKGVYGRIRPTLVHLIRAEGEYLRRIAGLNPWAEDLDWDTMSMSDLLLKAQLSGNQLINFAGEADPAAAHVIDRQGKAFHFYNWTVLLQALYHGIEHRTQIKMLLTQIGFAHPELAAWDFMDSLP